MFGHLSILALNAFDSIDLVGMSVSWKHAYDKLAAPKLCVGAVAPLSLSVFFVHSPCCAFTLQLYL